VGKEGQVMWVWGMVEGEGGAVGVMRDCCHHGFVDVIEGGGR
jgi:hypothetical protein